MGITGLGVSRASHPDMVQEIVVVDEAAALHATLSLEFSRDSVMLTRVPDRAACLELVAGRAPAVIVVDLGPSPQAGLDLLRDLRLRRCPAPAVATSSGASIRLAVEAMKRGAFDFFEIPFDTGPLAARLRDMLEMADPLHGQAIVTSAPLPGATIIGLPSRDVLTRREHEVLSQIAGGASNKEVGRLLGISPRTVEVHRARIMEKLGARNAADLVRIVMSEQRV